MASPRGVEPLSPP